MKASRVGHHGRFSERALSWVFEAALNILSSGDPISELDPTDHAIERTREELVVAVRDLAQRTRRSYLCRAIVLWLSIFLMATMVLAALDTMVRSEEFGVRMLLSLFALALGIAAAHWLIRPAWRFLPTSLDIARGVEQVRPELRERLSTVVELAEAPHEDPRFGSPAFRKAVLRQWHRDRSVLNWNSLVDAAQVWRAVGVLAVVSSAVLLLACIRPHESRMALHRLFVPWSAIQWPRADQLRILGPPDSIIAGSPLLVEVLDSNAPLPAKVDLQIRRLADSHADGGVFESSPMRVLSNVAVASIASVNEPIEIRAVGGDDSFMKWYRINVVAAPKLLDHRFRIEPPDYTGQPQRELVGKRIEVLQDSKIQFSGTFAEPVLAVDPVLQPNTEGGVYSGDAAAIESPWVVVIEGQGKRVELLNSDSKPWVADRTIGWRLRIKVTEDLDVLDRDVWEVIVNRDAVPIVTLGQFESRAVTASAALRLKGRAADDVGLREISVAWEIGDSKVPTGNKVSLWSIASRERAEAQPRAGEKQIDIDADFDLATHLSTTIGQDVSVWLEAEDVKGQIGRSQPQMLAIRATEDVLAAIETGQSKVYEQLRQLVQLQRRNAELAARTDSIFEQTQSVRSEEIDSLSSIAQLQNSIQQGLVKESTGVLSMVESMIEQLRQNGLESSSSGKELSALANDVRRVATQALSSASEETRLAVDAARRDAAASSSPIRETLDATKRSTQALETAKVDLEALAQSLAEAESTRQLHRDLAEVLHRQQEIRRETDQLAVAAVSGTDGQDRDAARAGLRSDQQGLARTVDELIARSKKLSDVSSEGQPDARQAAEATRQSLLESQVSQAMREAAELVNRDRFAEASEAQRQIAEKLRDALQELNHFKHPLTQEDPQQQLTLLGVTLEELVRQQEKIVADPVMSGTLAQVNPAERDENLRESPNIRQLAARQEAVRQMVRDVRERAAQLPAFDWVLEQTDGELQRSVAALRRGRIRPDAQAAASEGLKKLKLAAESLKSKNSNPNGQSPSTDRDPQQPPIDNEPKPDSLPLASLKLLRAMQYDINEETKVLNAQRGKSDSAQHVTRLQQVTAQQRSLGLLLKELLDQLAKENTGSR